MDLNDRSCSGWICEYCSKRGHPRGVVIHLENNVVTGYDCEYPDCRQDCSVVLDRPVGYRQDYFHKPST